MCVPFRHGDSCVRLRYIPTRAATLHLGESPGSQPDGCCAEGAADAAHRQASAIRSHGYPRSSPCAHRYRPTAWSHAGVAWHACMHADNISLATRSCLREGVRQRREMMGCFSSVDCTSDWPSRHKRYCRWCWRPRMGACCSSATQTASSSDFHGLQGSLLWAGSQRNLSQL
jgi:hypothetical protein